MQKKIVVGMIVLVVLGLVGYLMGSQYYAERYYLNTEFAAVDISNLTQAEAADKLKESFSQQSINFNEADREWETLNASDLGISIQADEALASLMSEQHKQNWLVGAVTDTQIAYAPQALITIDDKQLQ